jgi:Raf kinase inhibitor-like YbhB/YbcL family protein
MRRTLYLFLATIPWLASCGRENPGSTSSDAILGEAKSQRGWGATIRVSSPAFADGGTIPKVHTCDGDETSPPLAWSDIPRAARALVLICEDPDAPGGTFTHWVLFNLPPALEGLAAGLPPKDQVDLPAASGESPVRALQGTNDFGSPGYGGPCPPGGTHRYVFLLYALDARLESPPGTTRTELLRAMKGHILAEGRLMGRYAR